MTMKARTRIYRALHAIVVACVFLAITALVGEAGEDKRPAGIMRLIPGHGNFVAGDLWCNITPMNREVWYRQARVDFDPAAAAVPGVSASQNQTLFRLGNATRTWEEPVPQWPSGFPAGNYWSSNFEGVVYDRSPAFNPAGKRSHYAVAGPHYAFMFFTNQLPGATDPARNYAREVRFTDATRRDQVIYEVGFPTNVGIDIRLVARQFTLNWNNLNDFILYEFSFTNTGVVDIEGDGVIDQTGHRIDAFTFGSTREVVMHSGGAEFSGTRGTDFSCPRLAGYVGDDDPDGRPWDMTVSFPGAFPASAPRKADFGMNQYGSKIYTDRWMGMSWLAAKRGSGNPANPDKLTIFGTHGIGTGTNRGWFSASGQGEDLIVGTRFDTFLAAGVPIGGPKVCFTAYAGAFYEDGGKSMSGARIRSPRPNPRFFDARPTDTDNVTEWVVKPSIRAKLAAGTPLVESERPNGSMNLRSLDPAFPLAFYQKWEDGAASATTTYPAGWGRWTKGWSWDSNFASGLFVGIGPFSLDVGETMTVVFVEYAGFRLEGVQRSLRSARWAYERAWAPAPGGFTLPFSIPRAPEMRVDITPVGTVNILWDDRAETDADFAGYKIWRSSNAPPNFKWTESGMRVVDRYQEQMEPGPIRDEFKKPVNPKFAAYDDIAATATRGEAPGREWGPYSLVATIPKGRLGAYTSPTGAYKYLFEDKTVIYGFDYWYYVAAYKEGTYTMYPGETIGRIESSNINRNGRTGLWLGTYSYADRNAFFPTTDAGRKDIGARFTVRSRTASLADLNAGKLVPQVIPNPYKRTAAFDDIRSSIDHKIKFFNLPARGRLTILDVAGQIVDQIEFDNPTGVSDVTWTMFSKDGVEVANGVYIYVVEAGAGVGSPSGKFTYVGKFAILR